ncbi:Annexin A7 [Ceratocystis fimbriata CBS 114723]|uniref:Annexin n=1 Tax=Ceratocystis fimbriata CBS 114723 TaxID=1035309 RepID=A0A2C5X3J7_9PEZI|nr:Annexin A7 [Ceratocystis fimbriata CBS 114723]
MAYHYPHQGYGQQPQYPPQGQYPPPPPSGQYPPHNQQYGQYPPSQQTQYAPPPGPPPGQPQYGAPPGQHGALTQYPPPPGPPSQYGAPPPSQYGAPPPAPYSAPSYGAPPPGQYPPPAGQYGHQQPMPGGGYPPYVPADQPSPGYGAPQVIAWNADPIASACRSAMKGFGTDEKALIRALADKDPHQIEAIKQSFERQYRRNLIKDVESETSGDFQLTLLAILRGPCLNDAYELHRAIIGAGTNERALNDVLLGRSNADMHAIKSMYNRTYRRDLEADVKGDLSAKTERMFMIVLGGTRADSQVQVQSHQADADAQVIYQAGEGRLGTDQISICSLFATRNDAQIRAFADAYRRNYSKDLEDVIKKEFSGHMEDALLYQLRHAVNPCKNAAREIERAMAGMGTDEKALTRRIVAAHWDRNFMEGVKVEYQRMYNRDLARRIKGETRGDFERVLLACIGYAI